MSKRTEEEDYKLEAADYMWNELCDLFPVCPIQYLNGEYEIISQSQVTDLHHYQSDLIPTNDEPPIYLRVWVGQMYGRRSAYYKWHVIKPGNVTPQDAFLDEKILPAEPIAQDLNHSEAVSIGSRIYLIGGIRQGYVSENIWTKRSAVQDVYYMDITDDGGGGLKWEEGPPLLMPLESTCAIPLNNNNDDREDSVFVFGWDLQDNYVQPQVLKGGNWRLLEEKDVYAVPRDYFYSHFVDNTQKRVLVYTSDSSDLHEFNFSSGTFNTVCREISPCLSFNETVLVDGFLYTLDPKSPGYMFALDTSSSSQKEKIPVTLKYPPSEGHIWWVPQQGEHDYGPPPFFMVPLGKRKLAIIWQTLVEKSVEYEGNEFRQEYHMVIWCTRWIVSKSRLATREFELTAYSRARYLSDAVKLVNCLPIVQSQAGETVDDAANPLFGMGRSSV